MWINIVCVLIPEHYVLHSFAYLFLFVFGANSQVVLKKNMIKRDLGNCKSVDSLGHVNYTVPVMIIVPCVSMFYFIYLFIFFASNIYFLWDVAVFCDSGFLFFYSSSFPVVCIFVLVIYNLFWE